jgi:tetratricopeptide (TPR) repeat protein
MVNNLPERCALCGAEIDPTVGGCAVCLPHPNHPTEVVALSASVPATADARPAPQVETQPLEFEAEEHLARGDAARALVLASSALKQRPESLTLRGLVDRARKAVLRGRRGERLEQRLREAHDLLERGELRGAEGIATSALKLVPNHAEALALFAAIKERRLAADTIEAEVERELQRIASAQARQAAERARVLRGEGNERGAFVAVRRGLRHAPDDADLLSLFSELRQNLARAAETHDALRERIDQARAQLAAGLISESRDALREALREDPDSESAQALMKQVRAAFLAQDVAAVRAEPTAAPSIEARGTSVPVSRVAWATRSPGIAPRSAAARGGARARTWRRATLALLATGGLVAVGAILFWAMRTLTTTSSQDPLAGAAPELRLAIEAVLGEYKAAAEARDPAALERARPDLPETARDALIAALNESSAVGVELRVVGVEANAQRARVHILRALVVTSAPPSSPPVEETLRFVRRGEAWHLR